MAHYGQLLDAFQPEKDAIYSYFDEYFGTPVMTKIKNVDGYSMYMTKIYCLLTNDYRYIIAMVPKDTFLIKAQKSLKDMSWISLQTRTLKYNHDIPSHNYNPVNGGPLKKLISKVQNTNEASTYTCEELPIIVTLLHTKSDSKFEYQSKGTIISALETYQTVITIKNF